MVAKFSIFLELYAISLRNLRRGNSNLLRTELNASCLAPGLWIVKRDTDPVVCREQDGLMPTK